jgi:hypothetical protein
MLAITIIIVALILAALFGFFNFFYDPSVPCVFQILNIKHTNDYGVMKNEGLVSLQNIGTNDYLNWNLYAKTYVNDVPIEAKITTMNADETINSDHDGFQWIKGPGTHGASHSSIAKWYSGQPAWINYNNGKIRPGDKVTIEFYDKSTGRIISRDTWPHTDPRYTTEWWMSRFIHPAA